MRLTRVVRGSMAIVPLLRTAKRVDGKATPEELVSISQNCAAIRSVQVTSEFEALANLVKDHQCRSLLEIGTYWGGTLFVFSQVAARDATVISLDCAFNLFGKLCRVGQKVFFRGLVRRGQKLLLFDSDSHKPESLAAIESKLKGNKLDFLFIDGDHSYEGVKQDFKMYAPLVRSGGIIAFHDVAHDTETKKVHRFWEEIKGQYQHREFIHKTGKGAMGIGVVWV
jgi:cephalosporin hydroxylase